MIFLLVLLGFAAFWSIASLHINYSVYWDMTTDHCNRLARGSYSEFLREFTAREWARDQSFPKSYFGQGSRIHAAIIEFDGVGMLLGPIDAFRVKLFLRRHRLVPKNKSIPAWSAR
jgi:hypothetical protein